MFDATSPGASPSRAAFQRARRECFEAFSKWVQEESDQAAIREEIDATSGVLRQLAELWLGVD
jgi:hypothetical protein